jgi:hypothetical protein
MRERLELVRDRKAPIECPVTLAQRCVHAVSHTIDKHGNATVMVMGGLGLALAASLGALVWLLLR